MRDGIIHISLQCQCFEVIDELRKSEAAWRDTPVIFLTADEDEDIETRGLSHGAMDFIRKPFVDSVLVLRVKHAVELIRLQRDLESVVDEKARENENLFMHVVESLADAIDAKDNYTNGHSGRGYPEGLSREDIPEEARIIAVADAYDAMTSNRSYRYNAEND